MIDHKRNAQVQKIITLLSSSSVIFILVPVLMAVLIAGTVAQKYIGLYESHKIFFSFFYFWNGVPVPSGLSLLAVFTLSLLARFLFKSDWSLKKAGIHITHLGVIILLTGGLASAASQKESYIVIPEGKTGHFISDYHKRELLILKNEQVLKRVEFNTIQENSSLKTQPALPFEIYVKSTCRNCRIVKREAAEEDGSSKLKSMAQFMALEKGALEPDDEINMNGMTLEISGTSNAGDGQYILFESMPDPIVLEHKENTYELILGKAQRPLPFSITLQDFAKDLYPGTRMAKSYSSEILVRDGEMQWPARIEMNRPFRYKNFTFFQSSFLENDKETATVLSVVYNENWPVPYIASLILVFGLFLHGLIMLCETKKFRKQV